MARNVSRPVSAVFRSIPFVPRVARTSRTNPGCAGRRWARAASFFSRPSPTSAGGGRWARTDIFPFHTKDLRTSNLYYRLFCSSFLCAHRSGSGASDGPPGGYASSSNDAIANASSGWWKPFPFSMRKEPMTRASIHQAAPSAVPASSAAGCVQIFANGPWSRSQAFITQFSATPPARQRVSSLVCS